MFCIAQNVVTSQPPELDRCCARSGVVLKRESKSSPCRIPQPLRYKRSHSSSDRQECIVKRRLLLHPNPGVDHKKFWRGNRRAKRSEEGAPPSGGRVWDPGVHCSRTTGCGILKSMVLWQQGVGSWGPPLQNNRVWDPGVHCSRTAGCGILGSTAPEQQGVGSWGPLLQNSRVWDPGVHCSRTAGCGISTTKG